MLILLDRDGVINHDMPSGVHNLAMFTIIPRALDAIAALCNAGHTLCVVTNQSSVGRGWMSLEALEEIHRYLHDTVLQTGGNIAAIYAAIDAPDAPSHRRKPAPDMLLEAMRDFQTSPQDTLLIGDAMRDLEAAARAQCASILVRTGKGAQTEKDYAAEGLHPIAICDDLWHASKHVLALQNKSR